MMPQCSFKRCKRVSDYLLDITHRQNKYGEGITLCSKHINKFPDLKYFIERDLRSNDEN